MLAVGLLCLAYAYFVEPQQLVVTRAEVPVPRLDPGLVGLRIVCLSDIHAGSNGADREKLRRVVESVNAEDADLVVMLGDYLSRPSKASQSLLMEPKDIVAGLEGMRAKYGVYLVKGNHDVGPESDELMNRFAAAGYNVLNGKVAVIDVNGTPLRLLGLRDHQQITIWRNYSDDARALLAPTEGKGNVIVLQHSPDILPIITGPYGISNDLRLMLSGHTHGGQVWLPVIGAPIVSSANGQKYRRGLITDSVIPIYITTGIGTSILPFRFMVPPEIAVITLRAA